MDLNKCFGQDNFDSFKNIYTIQVKEYKGKNKYYPIYGHFYNNANNFICKKIFNNKIQDVKYPDKYLILKYTDIAKTIHNDYYQASTLDELLYIVNKLNEKSST